MKSMNSVMKISTLLRFIFSFSYARIFGINLPLLVGFSLTDRCPFHCLYCFFSSRRFKELSLADIINIIDKLCDYGMLIIEFTGGEPCLRDDLYHIVKYAKKKKLLVILSTSGYHIQQHEEALKYIDKIYLSLDGPKEVNDKLRGRGAFEIAIAAADFLKKKNKRFFFRTVLTSLNLNCVTNVMTIAENYVTKVKFQPMWVSLHHEDCSFKQLISQPSSFNSALEKLINLKKKGRAVENAFFALRTFKILLPVPELPNKKSCVSGKLFFRVQSDGNFQPCAKQIFCDDKTTSQLNLKETFDVDFKSYLKRPRQSFCHVCSDGSLVELNGLYNLNLLAIESLFSYLMSID